MIQPTREGEPSVAVAATGAIVAVGLHTDGRRTMECLLAGVAPGMVDGLRQPVANPLEEGGKPGLACG